MTNQEAALDLIARIDTEVMSPTSDTAFDALMREGEALMVLLPRDAAVQEYDSVIGYDGEPPLTDGDLFIHMDWAKARRSGNV